MMKSTNCKRKENLFMSLIPRCLLDKILLPRNALGGIFSLINCRRYQIWDEGENQRPSHLPIPVKVVKLQPLSPNPHLYHTIKLYRDIN